MPTRAFTADRPQHLFINRAPGQAWNQNRPETITDELFMEVIKGVGETHDPTATRRVGLSFILSYLNGPRDVLTDTLRHMLAAAERLDVPLLLCLDGVNWWDRRPDLWNWFDPSLPGFDRANVHNVEWTGPSPEHAVKVCWRNWGRQLRVRPAPNLHSARFRDAGRPELVHLATIIRDWADRLPESKRHLFPGIKIGWEASIGVNAFYYPDGNRYYERHPADESHDPTHGMDMAKDFAGGLVPLGYAALASEGKTPPGHAVTLEDHERLVADYLQFLAATCRTVGYAPSELFLHCGGQFAPWDRHYSHRTPITPDGVPGYSLYNTVPENAGDLGEALAEAGRSDWCACEWLTFAKTADTWAHDLRQTMDFRHCRSLTIYNWEGISGSPFALEGIRRTLAVGRRPQ